MQLIQILTWPGLILVVVILAKLTIERHYLKKRQYEELKQALYDDMAKVVTTVNDNTKTISEIDGKVSKLSSQVTLRFGE